MDLQQILSAIREKTSRLAELREEAKALEAELEQVRGLVAQNGGARAKAPARHGFAGGRRRRPIQDGSSVWWAKKVLSEAGGPLTADELVKRISQLSGQEVRKPTLVSNLSRYHKFSDTFFRTGPNTYGLLDNSDQRGNGGAE